MQSFPTEWKWGKPVGSIAKYNTQGWSYKYNSKVIQTFKNIDHGGSVQAKTAAEEYKQRYSDEHKLSTNRIRYIDPNTIEVESTNQNALIRVDACHLDKIKTNSISVSKSKGKLHALYGKKGEKKTLTLLLGYTNVVSYIDNNPLNCCDNNLTWSGKGIECENHYQYFSMPLDKLPEKKWILGKVAGSVFPNKDDKWIMRISYKKNMDGTIEAIENTSEEPKRKSKKKDINTSEEIPKEPKSKSKKKDTEENNPKEPKSESENKKNIVHIDLKFNYEKYGSKEAAYKAADEKRCNISTQLGLTKNMIWIEGERIKVQLSKNQEMWTDKVFIPLIQEISLFSSAAGGSTIYYAHSTVEKKQHRFHRIITGFDMVDHIDHNPMNNCLSNLRWTDYSLNNSNRQKSTKPKKVSKKETLSKSTTEFVGVRTYIKNGVTSVEARMKYKGKEYTKWFTVTSTRTEDTSKRTCL